MMSVYQTSKENQQSKEPSAPPDVSQTEQHLKALRKQVAAIARPMQQAKDIQSLLNVTVEEVQDILESDRTLIYQFNNSQEGIVLAENKEAGWTPMQGETLPATTFGLNTKEEYETTSVVAIDTTTQNNLTPYQQQLLNRFQVQASLSIPIRVAHQVWGLLVIQRCAKAYQWKELEISFLEQVSQCLTQNLQLLEFKQQLQQQQQQQKAVAKVIDKIRRSLNTEAIFKTLTQEVRNLLKADRVGVYRFNPDWSGEFVYESVGGNWTRLVGPGIKTVWEDTHLQETKGGRYRYHETFAVDDVYTIGHSQCHVDILEQFEVRAYVIVPIFVGDKLWGLLGVYQNSGPRHWSETEISDLNRIAAQLWEALLQADTLQDVKEKSAQLGQKAEQERTLTKVINRIRQSLDLENIFKVTAQEVRSLIKADRVAVFRFNPDWTGVFVSESVAPGWVSLVEKQYDIDRLQESIRDCQTVRKVIRGTNVAREAPTRQILMDDVMQQTQGGQELPSDIFVRDNIYEAGFNPCYVEVLEQYQAKAYVIVSIYKGDQLWGMLAAYQNGEPRHWKESEVNLLQQIASQLGVALQQAEYLQQLQVQSQQLSAAAERERTLTKVIDRIRKSFDLGSIFRTTTYEVRQLIQVDRVAIYKFRPDYFGDFIAESEAPGEPKLVGPDRLTAWEDPYLNEHQGGRFRENQVLVVDDVYNAGLTDCHVEALEMFHVKACVVVAIFKGEKLWGLLSAFQNKETRHWEQFEVDLLRQIATQIGIAIQQAEYLQEVQEKSSQLLASAEREKEAKESLQQRAASLLIAVRPALEGDLTVRAPVTEDEVGTIADAYNNTLQSLRKIILQVQEAADKVAETSRNSDTSVGELTNLAQQQYQDISQALQKISEMVASTNAVADNAQRVEDAVQRANQTVELGDQAMNRTVGSIQVIRDTVSQTAKKIKQLSESSQKISKAVNLISSFATQTNVLALNAAIEATRAGEYGKGFAVVAEEVRSLSRQSAEATKEIEELVKEIQSETGEVAATMEMGIQQVVEGTNLVNETRESLNEIVSATTEISQLVEQITQATQRQTQESELVTQVMSEVAQVSNQTLNESTQMSASFKELLNMAQELLSTSGKFKVN